ncbi:MAG: hypothetical protein RL172_1972 [Bacteroidota bacterium]|jgi:hypothetical protein
MQKYRQLFENIFGKLPDDTGTSTYLQELVNQHPYFTPARFYLLLQTPTNSPLYQQQLQATAAQFNNPYWLNYLLSEYEASPGQQQAPATAQMDAFIPTETIADTDSNTVTSVDVSTNENDLVTDWTLQEPSILQTPAVKLTADEELLLNQLTTTHINSPTIITEETDLQNDALPTTESQPDTEPAIAPVLTANTSIAAAAAILGAAPVADGPLFEPLHTTDYFASVGIKLSEEVASTDKLGKQLRSFTDWLKTMKKLQPDQAADTVVTEQTNSNIQRLAEKSNAEDEVITEAMADVLIQQGRHTKAIEVLKKLSLLNPGKSTYFAAKIEKIKEP